MFFYSIYYNMKKFMTYLATVVLLAQTFLPSVLLAENETLVETEGGGSETVITQDWEELLVVTAESPVDTYKKFETNGEACSPTSDGNGVLPDVLPKAGDTFAYILKVKDNAVTEDVGSYYLYYGGREEAPIYKCESNIINSCNSKTEIDGDNMCTYYKRTAWNNSTCIFDKKEKAKESWEYKPTTFTFEEENNSNALLPWILTGNPAGYLIDIIPLNINDVYFSFLWIDIWGKSMFDLFASQKEQEWIPLWSISIWLPSWMNPVLSLLGISSTDGLLKKIVEDMGGEVNRCSIDAELPDELPVEGCNGQALTDFRNILNNGITFPTLGDLESNIWSIGGIATAIQSIIWKIQDGTFTTNDLQELQNALETMNLPELSEISSMLEDMASILENPCLKALVDTTSVVKSLKDTADSLNKIDLGLKGIEDAIESFVQAGQPSDYFNALADLLQGSKDIIDGTIGLGEEITNLSSLLGALEKILGADNLKPLSKLFDGIGGVISAITGPLTSVSDVLEDAIAGIKDVTALVKSIEDLTKAMQEATANPNPTTLKNVDDAIDALLENIDKLANTTFGSEFLGLKDAARKVIIEAKTIYDTLQEIKDILTSGLTLPTTCADLGSEIDKVAGNMTKLATLYGKISTSLTNIDTLIPLNLFGNIQKALVETIKSLNDTATQMNGLKAEEDCEKIIDEINRINDEIKDAIEDFKTIVEIIEKTIPEIGKIIDEILENAPEIIKNIIQGEIDKLLPLLEGRLEALIKELRTTLEVLAKQVYDETIVFLEKNKLPAPTLGEAYICSTTILTTGNEETLTMSLPSPDKANETRGYVAVVIDSAEEQSLYVLPGASEKEFKLDTTNTGKYTIEIRAIGKDALIHSEPVFDFFAKVDLNQDWAEVVADAEAFFKTQGQAQWNKIPRQLQTLILLIVNNAVPQEAKDFVTNALQDIQEVVNQITTTVATIQSTIDAVNEVMGEWIEITENANDIIKGLKKLDDSENALAQAARNETSTTTIVKVSTPEIDNISSKGKVNENIKVTFSGYDADGDAVTYYYNNGASSGDTMTNKYSTAGTYTGEYIACKTVTLECGAEVEICSTPAEWKIEVEATKTTWGGGWGGGGSTDYCPNGDNSGSLSDWRCEAPEDEITPTEEVILWGDIDNVSTAKCSIEGSTYTQEENLAYLYACEKDITTIRSINDARMHDFLTRAEMAKVVSQYLIAVLNKSPNTEKDCSAFDNSIAHYNQEMRDYMRISCQFDVMGIHPNRTPLSDFMPDKFVSRAEFGTIFSRILRGSTNEGTDEFWYQNHLLALKNNKIITNTTPTIQEVRAWVFLMIYRSATNDLVLQDEEVTE